MISRPANYSELLTPPGAGAIGVVRVTGSDAPIIVDRVFRANNPRPFSANAPNRIVYGRFVVGDEVIDDVLVSSVPDRVPPAVDLCAHGGVRILERILEALQREGAPIRESSEEYARVWPAANRIQQEIVEALQQARTDRAVRFIARQHHNLMPSLERIAAIIESDLEQARERLGVMLGGFRAARTLIEGATLAIVGPPNSGKSTLFNRLVGRSAAVVSPLAGTTRDWVGQPVQMQGIPLFLVDTAGWQPSSDTLETMAIERGLEVGATAQVRLLVLDGSQPMGSGAVRRPWAPGKPSHWLIVVNKGDLTPAWPMDSLPPEVADLSRDRIEVSARNGTGIDHLVERITTALGFAGWDDEQPQFFTARQHEVVTELLADKSDDPVRAAVHLARLIGREG